jgi:putative FmdB family regulatory protein
MPPIYEYQCEKCDEAYEVLKSIKIYDGKDPCPQCGNVGDRVFSSKVSFIGAKVEDAEYNPAFGQVVKGKRHREELAKKNGMVEVGNENLGKHQDQLAQDKRKRQQKEWDNA